MCNIFQNYLGKKIVLLKVFYKQTAWERYHPSAVKKKMIIMEQIFYLPPSYEKASKSLILPFLFFLLFWGGGGAEGKPHYHVYWSMFIEEKGDKLKLHLLNNCHKVVCYQTLFRRQVRTELNANLFSTGFHLKSMML